MQFIETCCVHTIGKWAGLPFKLVPWQRDFIYEVFSNCDASGRRLTRRALLTVARKQGKSEIAAAVALYMLVADHEQSPEVYLAAVDRDQATIVYSVAAQMVKRSAALRNICKVLPSVKRIVCSANGGFLKAIAADAAGSHGFNASAIIFDELHTQRDRNLYDVLSTSTGAREQPLIFMITTAGFDKNNGPCYEVYQYAKAVLSGNIDDPSFVTRIFEVPQETTFETLAEQDADGNFIHEDDLWTLANPSLIGQPDGFVRPDEIRRAVSEAKHLPRARNHVLNLHMNIWTDAAEAWLEMATWDRCGGLVKEHELAGRDFFGGLDISHSQDFTAFCMLFPNEDETFQALWRFWLPEEALVKRGPTAPMLEQWSRAGFVTILPGEVIDLRVVGEQILKDCETFNCLSLGFDKFHAHSVISELMEQGIEMADVGQTFRHMNAPCKELERLLMQHRLNHGGNPVARWMAGNAVAEMNQDDNIRPSRKKSSDKIDGLVALLMAIERTLTAEDESFVMYVAGEEAE